MIARIIAVATIFVTVVGLAAAIDEQAAATPVFDNADQPRARSLRAADDNVPPAVPPMCRNSIRRADLQGPVIETLKDTVDIRARCCEACWNNPACIAYTYSQAWGGPGRVTHECVLKAGITLIDDMSLLSDVSIEAVLVPKRF